MYVVALSVVLRPLEGRVSVIAIGAGEDGQVQSQPVLEGPLNEWTIALLEQLRTNIDRTLAVYWKAQDYLAQGCETKEAYRLAAEQASLGESVPHEPTGQHWSWN